MDPTPGPTPVMLEYIADDGSVVCSGTGATREEAKEDAFRQARRTIVSLRAAVRPAETAVHKQYSVNVDTSAKSGTHDESSLSSLSVAKFDPATLEMPTSVLIVANRKCGRSKILHQVLHSMEKKFKSIVILGNWKPTSFKSDVAKVVSKHFTPQTLLELVVDAEQYLGCYFMAKRLAVVIRWECFSIDAASAQVVVDTLKRARHAGITVFHTVNTLVDLPAKSRESVNTVALAFNADPDTKKAVYCQYFRSVFSDSSSFLSTYEACAREKGACIVLCDGAEGRQVKHFSLTATPPASGAPTTSDSSSSP